MDISFLYIIRLSGYFLGFIKKKKKLDNSHFNNFFKKKNLITKQYNVRPFRFILFLFSLGIGIFVMDANSVATL